MTDKLLVYRRDAHGNRIPVPSNQRAPNRRYASVSSPDESYDLEFTDEEEKLRDEEEAKWTAAHPQREKEAQQRKEEAAKFRTSLQYENRVVAFLDILGWGNMIMKSSKDPELTRNLGIALNLYQGYAEMTEWTTRLGAEERWPGDPQITHFSDSILISVLSDNNASHVLLNYLQGIVMSLLNLGLLIRGGITLGQLIHRGPMAYGPALNQAYHLESTIAKFPRIILDHSLAKTWGQGSSVQNTDGSLIGHMKTWRQDSDGYRFYDLLQPYPNMPDIVINSSQVDMVLAPYRKLIVEGLENNKLNEKTFPKYQWGAKYFNDVLGEYPQSSLEEIKFHS
ncbi:MAG: hypothetical protein K0R76_154 [Alphaproteobacteria bacterium]|jgi:hypothetical protein|nr:hypothetical protein [Alphaproteobacteria bacterium]